MSNTDTGGPAFPTTVRTHYSEDTGSTWSEHIDPGMTLRDYFATKAMQGLLAGVHPVCREFEALPLVAKVAYQLADEMLKAREAV